MAKTIDYKKSGVDVGEGYKAVDEYKKSAAKTAIPGLLTGIGSFNGMFAVPKHIRRFFFSTTSHAARSTRRLRAKS